MEFAHWKSEPVPYGKKTLSGDTIERKMPEGTIIGTSLAPSPTASEIVPGSCRRTARTTCAFCEGDTVEAMYQGQKYYPGKISRDCGEGKYDIAYDDGDRERGVEARLIRKLSLSPLYIACKNGHVDAARLLLARGADIEANTAWNDTSLDIAKREGHKAVVVLLEEHQK